jgi:hypothetical protein
VHADAGGQRQHLLVEPVPAGDLERHQPHLPRTGGDPQRALDPANLQYVDVGRAQRDGSPDRDGIHQAAVEVVDALDLDRWQQPGHGARGQDRGHERAAAEPVPAGRLDPGGHALERQPQVGEILTRQRFGEHALERLERVQVRSRTDQPGRPAPQVLAEDLPQLVAFPHLAQPRRGGRRVGCDERSVERANGCAHDQVGLDAGLRQRPEHADLVRAEEPSAAEHERRRHGSSLASPRGQPRRIVSPSEANCSNGRW